MSKFFFEQLARILVEQVKKGDADRGLFVPIIKEMSVIRDIELSSLQIVHNAFEGLALPIEGLDKSYAFTRN